MPQGARAWLSGLSVAGEPRHCRSLGGLGPGPFLSALPPPRRLHRQWIDRSGASAPPAPGTGRWVADLSPGGNQQKVGARAPLPPSTTTWTLMLLGRGGTPRGHRTWRARRRSTRLVDPAWSRREAGAGPPRPDPSSPAADPSPSWLGLCDRESPSCSRRGTDGSSPPRRRNGTKHSLNDWRPPAHRWTPAVKSARGPLPRRAAGLGLVFRVRRSSSAALLVGQPQFFRPRETWSSIRAPDRGNRVATAATRHDQ